MLTDCIGIHIVDYGIAINVFKEVAEIICEHINETKQYECRFISEDELYYQFEEFKWIILFGVNDIKFRQIILPLNSIIVNLEQLYLESPWLSKQYIQLLKSFPVWDYNKNNIHFLKNQLNVQASLLQIGYSDVLLHKKFNNEEKKIDVLFYGSKSDRRDKIYKELIKIPGLIVIFRCSLWGENREMYINSAKIILNIHYYDDVHLFESIRIFGLLANKAFVITEDSDNMNEYDNLKPGLVTSKFENIKDNIIYYLRNDKKRNEIANKGYDIFRNIETIIPEI